jgi:hypothetical protein
MLPLPGRLSLSILSSRIIESIGTNKKIITIVECDSIEMFSVVICFKTIYLRLIRRACDHVATRPLASPDLIQLIVDKQLALNSWPAA